MPRSLGDRYVCEKCGAALAYESRAPAPRACPFGDLLWSADESCEQDSRDYNLELARRGAAFVVVHCPTDKTKKEAWDVIQPFAPLAAHYYSRVLVDHLAGGFRAH